MLQDQANPGQVEQLSMDLSAAYSGRGAEKLVSFRTSDINEATERITQMFGAHTLNPSGPGRDLEFEHAYAWISDICINYLAYGRELQNNIDVFKDPNYCLLFPVAGQYAISADGKRVEADADSITVINPICPVTLEAAQDFSNISVRLTRSAFDRALVRHLGEKQSAQVLFECHPQQLHAGSETLRDLVMQVWQASHDHHTLATYGAVGSELEVLLASLLLLNVPNNYSLKLARCNEIVPTAECKAAADYITSHASDPLQLEDIVRESGLAKTTLYTEFKKYYHVSPMEFLRVERLRLAYEILASSSAESVSVTHVAMDCGFTHFSRFANYYKKQFGELPSETLHRSRSRFQ